MPRDKRESDNKTHGGDDKPFPIIRKPVPISESGPLRPKKPRSAKKQPPILTTRVSDSQGQIQRDDRKKSVSTNQPDLDSELDFLDLDDSAPWLSEPVKSQPADSYTDERPAKSRFRILFAVLALLLIVVGAASFLKPQLFNDVPVAWLDSLFRSSTDTIDQDAVIDQTSTESRGADSGSSEVAVLPPLIPRSEPTEDAESSTQAVQVDGSPRFVSPLSNRFREQLEMLENLIESGSYDEAEQALLDMDRRVYGYGAREFEAMENRIAQLRSGSETVVATQQEAARVAEERAAAEALAAQQEAERLAQERAATEALAAQQEAERLAQERAATEALAAQQEAERLAQERAATEALAAQQEAERLAQERAAAEALAAQQEAEQLAQERAAAEALAAQQEAERLVQERAATEALAAQQEAERLAQERAAAESLAAQQEAERLAQERAAAESLAAQQEADRLAQERAATEALVAQQEAERLAQQRADEIEIASVESAGETDDFFVSSQARDESEVAETEIELSRTISDDDLQLVYARFDQLQKAISDRDIQAVISLTDRSVVRIQQFLQMFQNNVSIDARIKNVSTRNSRAEIQGTLVITRLERADGVVTGPPPDLASVTLTSSRNENGWSVIKW